MNGLLSRFFYLIYKVGKSYQRNIELKHFRNTSVIHEEAIIGEGANIYNCQRKEAIYIGPKTIVKGELLTFGHGGQITIGSHCFIGERTKIWSAKSITIGNRVLIAHNVNIHDQNSHPMDSQERHKDQIHIMEKGFQPVNNLNEREIVINDDVWIGFNSTILKGVVIGKGAIIGACCVITNDVPDYAVVVGNPSRIVKYTT